MNKYDSLIPEDDAVNAREELMQLIESLRHATTVPDRDTRYSLLIREMQGLCRRGRLDEGYWVERIFEEFS